MHLESSPANGQLPDHFPTIITEVGVHEGIIDFDVNIHRISERLADKGLTPEQIDETTIILSAKDTTRGNATIYGDYDSRAKTVRLYPVSRFQRNIKRYYDAKSDEEIAKIYKFSSYGVAGMMDYNLQHELEHRVIDTEGGMPEERRHELQRDIRKVGVACGLLIGDMVSLGIKEAYSPSQNMLELGATLVVLSGVWLASGLKAVSAIDRSAYRTSPEELRAQAAESDLERDRLFTVRLAYLDKPIRTLDPAAKHQ